MRTTLFAVPDNLTEEEVLRRYAEHVVALEGGNKMAAARRLNMSIRSLYRRLKQAA